MRVFAPARPRRQRSTTIPCGAPLSHENPISVALPLCLECHGGDDRARAKLHPCTPPYMATLAKNWRTWYGTGTMDRRYETMQTMNISLPDTMKHFIDAQVAAGGYSSASEYVRALVRDEQKRQARVRLETLLLEALDSGDPTAMTKADWDAIRREGLARLRARSTPPPEATP